MLEKIRLGDRDTLSEILKVLSEAEIFQILKLLHKIAAAQQSLMLERSASEFDFVQAVIDLAVTNGNLNLTMNAFAEAFRRQPLTGKFSAGISIKVDTLLFASMTGVNDSYCQTSDLKDRQKKDCVLRTT